MKKYFVLTSVLALAACGGGSGGNGGVSGMTDFERAAASNAKITGMVSRIQNGDSYNNLSQFWVGKSSCKSSSCCFRW